MFFSFCSFPTFVFSFFPQELGPKFEGDPKIGLPIFLTFLLIEIGSSWFVPQIDSLRSLTLFMYVHLCSLTPVDDASGPEENLFPWLHVTLPKDEGYRLDAVVTKFRANLLDTLDARDYAFSLKVALVGLGKCLTMGDGSLFAEDFCGFLGGHPFTLDMFMPSKPSILMNSSYVLLTLPR